jgi:hypothetical protein
MIKSNIVSAPGALLFYFNNNNILERMHYIDMKKYNNSKQFKEFNSELFKAYIAKFSDEDKVKAKEIIIQSLKK